jgi:hypothetical protein
MKHVYVENGKVREAVTVDPFGLFRYEYASLFVEAPDEVQAGWLVVNGGYEAPPVVVVVPATITRRQAIQQLIIEGLDDDVQAVIDSIQNVTQRKLLQAWYDESQVFERNRAEINQMWAALGRTQIQLDQMFIDAAKL